MSGTRDKGTRLRRSRSGSREPPSDSRLGNGGKRAARSESSPTCSGDLANLMHTDQTRVEDRIHSSYEEAVDDRSRKRGSTYKFNYDRRHSGKPGRKAMHAARASHRLYKRLVRAYNRNGYSPFVHRLTRRQLNRGANAVADVAGAIKAGAKRIRNQGAGGGGGGVTALRPIRTSVFRLHRQTSIATMSTARTSQSVLRTHMGSTAMVTASAARLDRVSDEPETDLQPVTIRRRAASCYGCRDLSRRHVSAGDPVASPHGV
jgi:hypothetical protein